MIQKLKIAPPELKINDKVICGIDETGLGSGVSFVVAAAVILPDDFSHPDLNDSKQLTKKQREALYPYIMEHAISVGIGQIGNQRIDEINVLQANFEAMHLAIENLTQIPEYILVDGNKFKAYPGIPHTAIVKGDAKIKSIAAASIIAKVYRDNILLELHKEHPEYSWNTNSGYLTPQHTRAIKEHGLTKHHRITFISPELIKHQIKLF